MLVPRPRHEAYRHASIMGTYIRSCIFAVASLAQMSCIVYDVPLHARSHDGEEFDTVWRAVELPSGCLVWEFRHVLHYLLVRRASLCLHRLVRL